MNNRMLATVFRFNLNSVVLRSSSDGQECLRAGLSPVITIGDKDDNMWGDVISEVADLLTRWSHGDLDKRFPINGFSILY